MLSVFVCMMVDNIPIQDN